MPRNILVAIAGIAVIACLLACQSEESVTGPVGLYDDEEPAIVGIVYRGSGTNNPQNGAKVTFTQYDEEDRLPFWTTYSGVPNKPDGYYYITTGIMAGHAGQDIIIEAFYDPNWYGSAMVWDYDPNAPLPYVRDIHMYQ